MPDRPSLRVVTFPADDAGLRADVGALLGATPERLEVDEPAALERRLRRWYRSIQVRRRDGLGGYDDDPVIVWYVYRDGRIRRRNEARDRLYRALAAARRTYRDSERALESARRIAGVFGTSTPRDGADDRD